MKPTITNLANYLGMTRQALYAMRKDHPKKFELIWDGWVKSCEMGNMNR